MHIIDTQVWKLLVSPKDRTLKYSYNLNIDGNQVPVQLYDTKIYSRKEKYLKKKYLSKYYLARGPRTSQDIKNRKLIVIFPGRNFNFFQKSNTKYFEKFYSTNKLDEFDMAIIIYPFKTINLEALSKSCEAALSQILAHGYRNENVSIMGWCLGGYFATETLRVFAENRFFSNTQIEKFNCFINNKSFVGIHDFLYYILPRYMRPILKFYPVKKHVKVWDNDSSESLRIFESNFEDIYVIYTDQDKIVNGFSHLYKHLDDLSDTINIKEDTEKSSHLPNWKLMADIFVRNEKKKLELD